MRVSRGFCIRKPEQDGGVQRQNGKSVTRLGGMRKGGRHCVLWKGVKGESVDRDRKCSLP